MKMNLSEFLEKYGIHFFNSDFYFYDGDLDDMERLWYFMNPRLLLTTVIRTRLFSDHDIRLCAIQFADMVSHLDNNHSSRVFLPVAREYLSLRDEHRRQRFFSAASSEFNQLICYQRDNNNRKKWSEIWATGSIMWTLSPSAQDAAEQAAMCARMALKLSVDEKNEDAEYMHAWRRQAEIISENVKNPFED